MKIIISIDGLSYMDLNAEYMPNLLELAKQSMFYPKVKTTFPSVTWSVHTSVATGKQPNQHEVYSNYFIDKNQQESNYWNQQLAKEDIVMKDTFYDKLKEQGNTIASVCWPLTQGAKNIDYNIPEFYTQEEFDCGCSADFLQELREKGFPIHRYGEWSANPLLGPLQDDLTWNILQYVITEKTPDVIMGHYLLIDTMQHEYGCGSPESIFAMRFVDDLIKKMIVFLKENKLWDSCELILFSDHGHQNFEDTWDIESFLTEHGLEESIQYADDGGVLNVYLKDSINLELENLLKQDLYIDKVFKNERPKERQPDYQIALKQGITSKKYRNNRKVGATHGYHPDSCDRMNVFAIRAKHNITPQMMDEVEITKIYEWMLEPNNTIKKRKED